jgi:16S rRNA (cytosine1402-N4)-methyltransferase
LVRSNFVDVTSALSTGCSPPVGRGTVNGALFDLGMSSMQVDTPQRGFSFLRDGPLDMRMDPDAPLTAEEVLNTWTEDDLGVMLRDYGEERKWRPIARRLCIERAKAPLRTTTQVAAACAAVIGHPPRGRNSGPGIHPATRTFQALRIAVNAELRVIEQALPAMIDFLAPGGRLAVISFHSLEDRIVKHIFRDAAGKAPPPDDAPSIRWGRRDGGLPPPPPPPAVVRLVTSKPLIADDAEARVNPRARSAKLRVVEKL